MVSTADLIAANKRLLKEIDGIVDASNSKEVHDDWAFARPILAPLIPRGDHADDVHDKLLIFKFSIVNV